MWYIIENHKMTSVHVLFVVLFLGSNVNISRTYKHFDGTQFINISSTIKHMEIGNFVIFNIEIRLISSKMSCLTSNCVIC